VPVRGAGFSPDGTRVVVTRLGELAPEDLQDPAKRARRKGLLSVLSFDPSVGRAGLWLEEAAREVPGARPSRYIGDRVFIPSEAGRMILWTPDPRTPWIGPQRDAPGDISIRADDRLRVSDVDPTGRRVAVGTADGTLQVWSFDHPTVPLVIQAHTGPVYGVAFSPDGEHIATTSKDGSVKLWSAPTTPEALDAALWAHPAPCLDVDQRRALGFHADTAAADYARCVARRSAAP
jgi:hypothetical protein